MKKLFITLMSIAALVLAGCNPYALNPSGGGGNGGGNGGGSGSGASTGQHVDPTDLTDAEIKKLDNRVEQCWCIHSVTTIYSERIEADQYVWCTEREVAEQTLEAIDVTIKTYQQYGVTANTDFEYYGVDAKSKEACEKLNKSTPGGGGGTGGGEKACYYVVGFTRDQYGHLVIEMNAYMWVTEDELADLMAELKNGWGVTETQAFPVNANDEYSCEHDEIDPEGWDEFWEKYSGYYD